MEYLPKGEPILEAGCGLGAWVVYLGDRGYDIAGIDNDAQVIGRLKEWRPSLNVSAGDIRGLPYETGSLGAVISLGVMEHFEEGCDEAMRETWRVLRPAGLLFFTVPLNNLFRKLVAHPMRGSTCGGEAPTGTASISRNSGIRPRKWSGCWRAMALRRS